jgi:hypothetical protein
VNAANAALIGSGHSVYFSFVGRDVVAIKSATGYAQLTLSDLAYSLITGYFPISVSGGTDRYHFNNLLFVNWREYMWISGGTAE